MKKLLKILVVFMITIGISGCLWDKSSNNSSSEDELNGVLVDTRINGVYYKTPTMSGFTHDGGVFSYKKGEVVNFYIGKDENGIKLGSVVAKGIITPDDIASGDDAIKTVQFLLSISSVSEDLMVVDEEAKEKLQTQFKNQNLLDINETELYDSIANISDKVYTFDEAKEHYNATLDSLTPKIGILLNLDNTLFKDLNTSLIPIIQEDISNYLSENKIPFRNINFIIKNTKNDKDLALSELEELKNDGVQIVIGPVSSDIADYLLDYANNNGIILVSPSSTASSLSIADDNLFRTIASDLQQAKALAYLIEQNTTIKNIVPVIRDDVYGNDYFNTLQSELSDKNILTPIKSSVANLSELEDVLANYDNNDTAIILIDFSDESKNILDNLSDKLSTYKWYTNNSLINLELNSSLKEKANKIALSGVTYTTDDNDFFVYYQTISSKLREKGMSDINPLIMNVWDSIWLVTELYAKNQNLIMNQEDEENNILNIKNLLITTSSLTYGVTGFMTLDQYGDRESSNFSYYTFANDKWNNIGVYKHNPLSPDEIEVHGIKNYNNVDANFTVGVIIENAYWNAYSEELLDLAKNRVNNYFTSKDVNFSVSLDVTENNGTNIDDDVILSQIRAYHEAGIDTVITILPSRALEVVQEYADINGMIIIDCASTAASLAQDDTVYRLTPTDNAEAGALSEKLFKDNVDKIVFIHVNDVYGDDYNTSLHASFTGTILKEITFEPGTYLDITKLTDDLSSLQDYAIVYVALEDEGIDFTNLPDSLKNIKWYGAGASSFNNNILNSGLDFTFINYDIDGFGLFMPQKYDLKQDVNSVYLDTNSINAYDAMYLAAVSKYDSLREGTDMKNSLVNRLNSMYGMSFFLGVNEFGDRATLNYSFYSIKNNEWILTDIYNNSGYGINTLY